MPHFWCGVMKLSTISASPLLRLPSIVGDGARIDRRPIDREALAEIAEPAMILIELLAAGQRAPRDQLVHVGVAGRVADMLALDAATTSATR